MEMLSKKQKILVIAGGIILLVVIGVYYFNSTKEIYVGSEELNTEVENMAQSSSKEEEEKIIVHVTGAVKNEGIVSVKENARINDVIEEAGGLKENADIENVNLAYVVEDGQKIYIPCKEDNKEAEDMNELVIENAGKDVIQSGEESERGGLININKADSKKLQELPGIRELHS